MKIKNQAKKSLVYLLTICLLSCASIPLLAADNTQNNRVKFLSARERLTLDKHKLEQKPQLAALLFPLSVALANGKLFASVEMTLLWFETVQRWNYFATELQEIGLPLELWRKISSLQNPSVEYSASVVTRYMPREKFIKDFSLIIDDNLTVKEAKALSAQLYDLIATLDDVTKNMQHILMNTDNTPADIIARARRVGGTMDEQVAKDVIFKSYEGFNKSYTEAINRLIVFRKRYPNFTYTVEYLADYMPRLYGTYANGVEVAVMRKPLLDRLLVPGKISSAQAKRARTIGLDLRKIDLEQTTVLSNVSAAEKRAIRQGSKTFAKQSVGKVAAKVGVGIGVGAALIALTEAIAHGQETHHIDLQIQKKLMSNPTLVIEMSDDEAQFIAAHAEQLTHTIETYDNIAQGIHEFSNLSQEEQTRLLNLISQEETENSSPRATITARQLRTVSSH